MKALLIAAVLIALMVFLGWITVYRGGDRPTVMLETERIEQDVNVAAEKASAAADRAAAEGRRLVDEARRTEVDVDVRREPADATVD